MNAVGIDVSKGKSMVAILRPLGEVVQTPMEIKHNKIDLKQLADLILTFVVFLCKKTTPDWVPDIAFFSLKILKINLLFLDNRFRHSIRADKSPPAA